MIRTAVSLAAVFAGGAVFAVNRDAARPVEFPIETEALVTATAALFEAVQADPVVEKKGVPVFRMPSLAKQIRAEAPRAEDVLRRNGPLRHLTGYRINWYPTERFLGAVDFMGTWDDNRNLVCGYLVWDLSDPRSPVLDRVDARYVNIDDLEDAAPDKVHATLLEANCAFGEIEANYAFFEVSG